MRGAVDFLLMPTLPRYGSLAGFNQMQDLRWDRPKGPMPKLPLSPTYAIGPAEPGWGNDRNGMTGPSPRPSDSGKLKRSRIRPAATSGGLILMLALPDSE